jgi:uncharacterized heparinase superfamily protein
MDLALRCEPAGVAVDCSHDGYRRLPGQPVHRRVWRMEARRLTVEDWVSGEYPGVARFILHPDVQVDRLATDRLVLTVGESDCVKLLVGEGELSLQQVHYASSFGVLRETACVEIELVSGRCAVCFEW